MLDNFDLLAKISSGIYSTILDFLQRFRQSFVAKNPKKNEDLCKKTKTIHFEIKENPLVFRRV